MQVANAFSQCLGAGPLGPGYGYGPNIAPGLTTPYGLGAGLAPSSFGLAPTALELGAPGPYGIEVAPGYGGTGVGDVAVAGEMPVAGTTIVAGQVPILGAVRFAGDLPAAGTVSIAGSCGCGCGAPYHY
ncbi:chorion class A proteins Ld24-like isoform X2 [Melitaea cinxia]|uniref:chorion class A proteins Ld24-like isoform X2 n=1 Tax=Melitaea cinxia TaxID=113334 RepID=UPI001E2703FF|nr:chorion class A proteins Ld24-like isoform X2 [Melitaea cinxia]